MGLNRFTQKVRQAVLDAQELTGEYHRSEIVPEHLAEGGYDRFTALARSSWLSNTIWSMGWCWPCSMAR